MSNHQANQHTERERRFRILQRRVIAMGMTLADKTEAQAILEELEEAEKQGGLSGFETSQFPWLKNLVKRIINLQP